MITSYGPENSGHLKIIQKYYGTTVMKMAEKSKKMQRELLEGVADPAPKKKTGKRGKKK